MSDEIAALRQQNLNRLAAMGGGFHPVDLLKARLDLVTDVLIAAVSANEEEAEQLGYELDLAWEQVLAENITEAEKAAAVSKLTLPGQQPLAFPT